VTSRSTQARRQGRSPGPAPRSPNASHSARPREFTVARDRPVARWGRRSSGCIRLGSSHPENARGAPPYCRRRATKKLDNADRSAATADTQATTLAADKKARRTKANRKERKRRKEAGGAPGRRSAGVTRLRADLTRNRVISSHSSGQRSERREGEGKRRSAENFVRRSPRRRSRLTARGLSSQRANGRRRRANGGK
jgi:hypothetical protein